MRAIGKVGSGVLMSSTLCAVVVLWAGEAAAQRPTVAVLGVASEEGDDERATAITAALREQLESDPAVRLSGSRASLSQMAMLQDCDIAESDCRVRVGKAVSADQVIYGGLRRAGARGHEVELRLFTTEDGKETQARRTVPASDADDALAEHARALLAALRGQSEPEPQALPPSEAGPPPVATVTPDVQPLEEAEADAAAPAAAEPSSNDWLGYTLIGTAAVSVGLTVFSWTQIKSAETDDSFVAYGEAVYVDDRTIKDVCVEADNGVLHGVSIETLTGARDACDKGQTFDVLQYVFLGAAVVSAGFGAYFLLDDDGNDTESGARDFSLRAQLGRDGGLVSIRLQH